MINTLIQIILVWMIIFCFVGIGYVIGYNNRKADDIYNARKESPND